MITLQVAFFFLLVLFVSMVFFALRKSWDTAKRSGKLDEYVKGSFIVSLIFATLLTGCIFGAKIVLF